MHNTSIRGPILIPRDGGRVDFIRDGVLAGDERGVISFVGTWDDFRQRFPNASPLRASDGVICPPFLDAHILIPQHPIRGHFMDGVPPNPDGGRLIAGLSRNVFPAEARCADADYTKRCVQQFLEDTLARGVVGGAAYMTVHIPAARIALDMLPDTWNVGPVLMNMNCPEYLRTDETTWQRDTEVLAHDFSKRLIITDRFAVAVDSKLRREAVALATRLGLRMQTHLNEQIREKDSVERTLYPDAGTYTNVYERDGLLARDAILAHCVRMHAQEWKPLARRRAAVAHCPTSNTLLGSGVIDLNALAGHGIEYALCTDVGASPTTSVLVEMTQFLKVHRGRSNHASPSEALYRATLAPAKILHIDDQVGRLEPGRPMSFIEVACEPNELRSDSVDDVILAALLDTSVRELDEFASRARGALDELEQRGLDLGPELQLLSDEVNRTVARLENKVRRVVLHGRVVHENRV